MTSMEETLIKKFESNEPIIRCTFKKYPSEKFIGIIAETFPEYTILSSHAVDVPQSELYRGIISMWKVTWQNAYAKRVLEEAKAVGILDIT